MTELLKNSGFKPGALVWPVILYQCDFQEAWLNQPRNSDFRINRGEVDMGQLMKAFNNIVYNVTIAAICEVMPLAVKV